MLHVLAGVLIVGAAVAEPWVDFDGAGRWLFAVYGAAAAIVVLGALGFYLAYVAELPPPPPKPMKVRKPNTRRGRTAEAEHDDLEPDADEPAEPGSDESDDSEVTVDATGSQPTAESPPIVDTEFDAKVGTSQLRLRNRRPSGKVSGRRFRRSRDGGVALED